MTTGLLFVDQLFIHEIHIVLSLIIMYITVESVTTQQIDCILI